MREYPALLATVLLQDSDSSRAVPFRLGGRTGGVGTLDLLNYLWEMILGSVVEAWARDGVELKLAGEEASRWGWVRRCSRIRCQLKSASG